MTIPTNVRFREAAPALKLKWGTPETAPAAQPSAVEWAWTHIASCSPSG